MTSEPNSTTEEGNMQAELEQQYLEITESEILEEVRKLPRGKAPGPDGIVNDFLQAVIKLDPKGTADLNNMCLKDNYYPIDWKVSNLVLIHKPGRSPEDPSSYRPLCMLNTIGKLFERILARRLNAFLENSKILCD